MSDIKFSGGYNNCDDRMAILKNSVVQRRLDKFQQLLSEKFPSLKSGEAFVYVDGGVGKDERVDLLDILHADHVNANWDEQDPGSPAYIQNKPDISSTLLKDDMTAYYTVGGVKAGDTFAKGTSVVDIIMKMLSLESGEYMFYGKTLAIPTTVNGLTKLNISRQTLLQNGFTWNVDLENQFYILAMPKTMHLKLKSLACNTEMFQLDFKVDKTFNGNTCNMYYFDLPATGTYNLIYKFEEGDED